MNPYKEIKINLDLLSSRSQKNIAEIFILLIDILGEEDFNENFSMMAEYYKGYNDFYFNYHKQFRQVDMYDFEGCEQIGRSQYEKKKKYWDKRAEDKDGYIIQNGTYLHFSVGGHLDMIFWNMIHVNHKLWDESLKLVYKKYIKNKKV